MKEIRTSSTSASIIPVVGLLMLAGVFFDPGPAAAQGLGDCVLPEGANPPTEPHTTAQDVENGSATLKDFALAARDQFKVGSPTPEEAFYFGCLVRQEGSHWRSGSTYIVSMLADGRVFVHAKDMALSGRLLNPVIYGTILAALGVSPGDLANLASPDPAVAAQAFGAVMGTLMQEPDGAFDATAPIPGLSPGIPGASGYAAVYLSGNFALPVVMLVGFDINETHLAKEDIDYGAPAVAAEDVVDRESLKAFVTQAGEFILELQKTGDLAASSKLRIALRDADGPWRHGSVYLYVLDLTSNIILFHGAFPDRFELRPLVATVKDAVTGQLVLPQVIEAAKSSPEGGFVEYYFDDPTDDTDSADIPKVGYAREYHGEFDTGQRILRLNFIVGSGFYGRPADVGTGPSTVVDATVLGDAVEGLDVDFSRAIAGRQSEYAWSAVTDAAGLFTLTISGENDVTGYYRARATNADGEVVARWSSIPLNEGRRQVLELTLGGGARVVRVRELTTAEPVAAAKPVFEAETVPEASGLSPNSPNPFNSATVITYRISSAGPVKLVIYNVLGQPVRTLVDESRGAGSYQVRWDAKDDGGATLSTGVYIAHLSYPGGAQNQRLLYLK